MSIVDYIKGKVPKEEKKEEKKVVEPKKVDRYDMLTAIENIYSIADRIMRKLAWGGVSNGELLDAIKNIYEIAGNVLAHER